MFIQEFEGYILNYLAPLVSWIQMFITIHQTHELTPWHLFQWTNDHFWVQDKNKKINKQFSFLQDRPSFLLKKSFTYSHFCFTDSISQKKKTGHL